MMTILDYLRKVPDGRRGEGQKYKIEHILLFSIFAIFSGANDYEAIAVFIEEKFWDLTEIFSLKWVRPPTSNTIRNIFKQINTEDIEKAFREYSESLKKKDFKPYIAIDGKRLKGSYDHSIGRKALHILNMYATENEIILAHEDIESKSNEIPALRKLLKDMNLKGAIITVDALHTQKKQ